MDHLRQSLSQLDADGDGNISVEEAERAAREIQDTINKAVEQVRPFKALGQGFGGYLCCFYGGNFTHSYLAYSLLSTSHAAPLKRSIGELFDFSDKAKKDFLANADTSPSKSGKHVPLFSLSGLGLGLSGSASEETKNDAGASGMPIPTRTLLALVR